MRNLLLRAPGLALLLAAGLALQPFAARADPDPSAHLPESLVPGQAVIRAVWKGDILFVFEGNAGEVITISVTSKTPGIDPHVALLDPEKEVEAFDDDSGGHGDSLLKNHALKKSGRYTVRVGAAQGDKGKVEVLLERRTPEQGDEE